MSLWWALLLGLWAGRTLAAAPQGPQPLLDLALALGLALLVALTYVRWARGRLRSRSASTRRPPGDRPGRAGRD